MKISITDFTEHTIIKYLPAPNFWQMRTKLGVSQEEGCGVQPRSFLLGVQRWPAEEASELPSTPAKLTNQNGSIPLIRDSTG